MKKVRIDLEFLNYRGYVIGMIRGSHTTLVTLDFRDIEDIFSTIREEDCDFIMADDEFEVYLHHKDTGKPCILSGEFADIDECIKSISFL